MIQSTTLTRLDFIGLARLGKARAMVVAVVNTISGIGAMAGRAVRVPGRKCVTIRSSIMASIQSFQTGMIIVERSLKR